MAADFSIIIVNWRVRPLVEKCLQSIKRYQGDLKLEIIVVDNDSHDGLAEMLMMDWPEITYVGLTKNFGFAQANNFALQQASGEIICLLNPDTEVTENFFTIAKRYFDTHPDVAMVGPHLVNSDGSNQASVRRWPDFRSQALVLLKLIKVLPQQKYLANYLAQDFDYTKEQEVEQLMGAAMLIRAAVFKQIGLLDPHFFIWFEEVDFCKRAAQAGLKIVYLPSLKVIHHGGSSFELAATLPKQWIFDRSLVYYFWKHQAWWQALLITLLVPVNLFLTIIYAIFFKHKAARV